MSTTMRSVRLATQGEPISRGQSAAAPSWRRGLADLERWAAAKPAIAALTLTVAYLVALAALIAVLATSTMSTVVGVAVIVVFSVMVLACIAVGIYTVIPERTPS